MLCTPSSVIARQIAATAPAERSTQVRQSNPNERQVSGFRSSVRSSISAPLKVLRQVPLCWLRPPVASTPRGDSALSFGGIQGDFRTKVNRELRTSDASPYHCANPHRHNLAMEPQITHTYVLSVQNSRPDGRLIEEAFRQDDGDVELLTLYSGEAA